MKMRLLLFAIFVVSLAATPAVAQPAGQMNITGSLSISATGVDFLPAGGGNGAFVLTIEGQTGSFVPLAGTTGTIADLAWTAPPTPGAILLTAIPLWGGAFTSFAPGALTSVGCAAPPAAGQTCTPPGSNLSMINLSADSSMVVFVMQGVASNGLASNLFVATFTAQFADMNFQEIQTVLAGSGSVSTTFSAVVQVGALDPVSNFSITKDNGNTSVTAGTSTTYTIVVTNGGPDAGTATVIDTFPAGISSATWTCSASAGSSCASGGSSGNINTTVTLLSGGTATFTVTAAIAGDATGTISNTATVQSAADSDATNDAATDTDTINRPNDLSITKTNGTSTVTAGGPVSWTIVVSNPGPATATNAAVTDTLPTSVSGVTWSCSASPGSSCGAGAGNGNIATTVTLVAGGTATFLVSGTVDPAATGTLSNTAAVVTPAGDSDSNPNNNAATDTDTIAAIAVIPAAGDVALAALMLMLAAIGMMVVRRS